MLIMVVRVLGIALCVRVYHSAPYRTALTVVVSWAAHGNAVAAAYRLAEAARRQPVPNFAVERNEPEMFLSEATGA